MKTLQISRLTLLVSTTLMLAACTQQNLKETAAPQVSKNAAGTVLTRGTSYTQLLRLQNQTNTSFNGRIQLAFEDLAGTGIPIYESTNDGANWNHITNVQDQNHPGDPSWKLEWQPHIYELQRTAGNLAKGTLLLAANAVKFNANNDPIQFQLQLYSSTDQGRTWQFRSQYANGASLPNDPNNTGVWEPHLVLLDDGRLVVFYSSEQYKAQGYNQLLTRKVSNDGGLTWSAETNVVAIGGGAERPGMVTVARMGNGQYALAYEDVGGPQSGKVYVKFSADGLNWGSPTDRGVPVQTAGGTYGQATPVIRWFPVGGPKGTLIVSQQYTVGGSSGERKLYYNENYGQGPWWEMTAPVQTDGGNDHVGWTAGMLLKNDGQTVLHSASSALNGNINDNQIRYNTARIYPRRYQAENAQLTNAVKADEVLAWNHAKVGMIDYADSAVTFTVNVETAGTYPMTVRFNNTWGASSHNVSVNSGASFPVNYTNGAYNDWRLTTVNVNLNAGSNTIKFMKGANFTELDYIELPVRLNDNLTGTGKDQLNFQGTWTYGNACGDCIGNDDHYTNTANATSTLSFNGSQVRLYAAKAPHHGIAGVSIDNGPETLVDFYAAARQGKQVVYTSPVLSTGPHTIKVRATGTRNGSATDTFITVDAIDVSN